MPNDYGKALETDRQSRLRSSKRMMSDIPARLMVAYGLIALLLFAGIAAILWARHNTRSRRDARDRAMRNERHQRDMDAAEELSTDGRGDVSAR